MVEPAFYVVYADDARIHAVMGIAGLPVPQAVAGAASSAVNFKTFVAGSFRHVLLPPRGFKL